MTRKEPNGLVSVPADRPDRHAGAAKALPEAINDGTEKTAARKEHKVLQADANDSLYPRVVCATQMRNGNVCVTSSLNTRIEILRKVKRVFALSSIGRKPITLAERCIRARSFRRKSNDSGRRVNVPGHTKPL
jgi:hypothetical protein